ncbi:MAG: heavy metal-binding domain-containing protein [Clostridia bacterium]|nr:heavy metal-binding domain-containing protein [Clostridia bacterium]
MEDIIISTGDINNDYEVIDAIFALDSCKEGILRGADPNKAFDKVKNKLRKKCIELDGDAVINCQFEYRIRENGGFSGDKEVVEIFAYGTAVYLV